MAASPPVKHRYRRGPSSNGGISFTSRPKAVRMGTENTDVISPSLSGSLLRPNGISMTPPSTAARCRSTTPTTWRSSSTIIDGGRIWRPPKAPQAKKLPRGRRLPVGRTQPRNRFVRWLLRTAYFDACLRLQDERCIPAPHPVERVMANGWRFLHPAYVFLVDAIKSCTRGAYGTFSDSSASRM